MPAKKDKNKIVVKKVPLDYYPERFHATFPPMPILYLELLENKQKVKKDLRLKEYVPPVDRIELSNQVPTTEQAESQVDKEIDKDFEVKEYEEDTVMKKVGKKNIKILDLTDPDKEKKEEYPEDHFENRNESYTSSNEKRDSRENRERKEERTDKYERQNKEERNEERRTSREDEDLDYERIKKRLEQRYDRIKEEYRASRQSKDREKERYDKSSRNNSREDSYKYERRQDDRNESRNESSNESRNENRNYDEEKDYDTYKDTNNKEEDKPKNKLTNEDEVQRKIMDLFTADDKPTKQVSFQTNTQSTQNTQNTQNVQTTQSTQNAQNSSSTNAFVPPTLSQINNGVVRDNKGVRDMTRGLSKQEDEEDAERRLYLDKFSILKRKYKDFKMPEFSPYSDISIMKRTYDSAVKQLHLDSTVETYKKYLIGGFTLTQFLFSKFLKMDMTGFAEQQILSMNQYEQVLVEIGEKTYFKPPSKMAPEFKLVMLIGFNAVIFLISKMILKASGDNILTSINKAAEKKETQSASSSSSGPQKNHMKGPNMDDLADLQSMINGNKSKKD